MQELSCEVHIHHSRSRYRRNMTDLNGFTLLSLPGMEAFRWFRLAIFNQGWIASGFEVGASFALVHSCQDYDLFL